jgi:hypothetical protein
MSSEQAFIARIGTMSGLDNNVLESAATDHACAATLASVAFAAFLIVATTAAGFDAKGT